MASAFTLFTLSAALFISRSNLCRFCGLSASHLFANMHIGLSARQIYFGAVHFPLDVEVG